jgi:hypothetical protein
MSRDDEWYKDLLNRVRNIQPPITNQKVDYILRAKGSRDTDHTKRQILLRYYNSISQMPQPGTSLIDDLIPYFPRTARSILQYYVHNNPGAGLNRLIHIINTELRNESVARQQLRTRGGAAADHNQDDIQKRQFQQMISTPRMTAHQKQDARLFDKPGEDGTGESLINFLQKTYTVVNNQGSEQLLQQIRGNEELNNARVYNVRGDGFCLLNAWAQYNYFRMHRRRIEPPYPKVSVNVDNVKKLLRDAFRQCDSDIKDTFQLAKYEQSFVPIQKITPDTPNLHYIYMLLFPYFRIFPMHVMYHNINLREKNITTIVDTRKISEIRLDLPLLRIFTITDSLGNMGGHFRLLMDSEREQKSR